MVADVPDFCGRPLDFRQFYVNGKKAVRARDVADFEDMYRIIRVDMGAGSSCEENSESSLCRDGAA